MFSTKKNVLQLVSLLKKAGIRDYILCPGSRNIPLVQSLASIRTFHCLSVTDERSAGFYAIGWMQATGRPVAVCCTSGSAVLNLHPAVCEAYYQQLPLLLLTADRPQEWIGQMDGQTLPQTEVYGSLIKQCVRLPEVKYSLDGWHCNRLINEALYHLACFPKGPVQIDVPISEPFFDFSETTLPDERIIRHYQAIQTAVPKQLLRELNDSKRTLLIIGQRSFQEEELTPLLQLCHEKDIAVIGEHISNCYNGPILKHFDELLAASCVTENEAFRPDLVIYTGGHIVSKRLKQWLRTHPPRLQWWITTDDSMPDTFQHLTVTIQCPSPFDFLLQVIETRITEDKATSFTRQWEKAEEQFQLVKTNFLKKKVYCDITIVNCFTKLLAHQLFQVQPAIQVANSSMVRNLQLFDLPPQVRVLCNRGVNGIEGTLSTAIGYSLEYKGLTFCLIGDLSFFYDMNALWHHPLPSRLRLLLLNNGNGEIFHLLPHLQTPFLQSYISAAHSFHAEGWAKEAGLTYYRCDDNQSLEKAWNCFFSEEEEKPVLIEAVTDSQTNATFYKALYNQLKQIEL